MNADNKTVGDIVTESASDIIRLIPLNDLQPFLKHVFKAKTEAELEQMTDSIKAIGVIQPIIVRPFKRANNYEIISGHSRVAAAKKAGLKEIQAIVMEKSDDEAMFLSIETNISQRSFGNWLHSEKARSIFAYHEIIKNPGKRTDLEARFTSGGKRPRTEDSRSRLKTALAYGESEFIIKLYLALNKLSASLMERLDNKEFGTSVAYEFSFVNEVGQELIDSVLGEKASDEKYNVTVETAKRIRFLEESSFQNMNDSDKELIKVKIRKILTSEDVAKSKETRTEHMNVKLPIGPYTHFFRDKQDDEVSEITLAALERYFEWLSEQNNEGESV